MPDLSFCYTIIRKLCCQIVDGILPNMKLISTRKIIVACLTLPGNPVLVAGVTVALEGWGGWSGKYIVSQARHTVGGGGGYTTQVQLRRCLTGY